MNSCCLSAKIFCILHFAFCIISLVEMMGFDSRANYALGLPRSRTSTGSSLCTVSPSNPPLRVTDFSKNLLLGGDDGIRTHDPLLAGQVLSQLSYTPIRIWFVVFSVSSVKEGSFASLLPKMSALSYLPVQSPVKYFHHCRA